MSEIIEINIKTNAGQAANETTSLRQQVRELRKEMEATEVGSAAYNNALVKLAQTTHDFKDQQEMIKNSAGDLGTVFGNLQSVSSGVVSGFSAINAITTLFGANSEDLQKIMVKLQAGMALVQGMQGLEGMGKRFTALVTSVKSMITTTKEQSAANKALAASEGTVTAATKATSAAMKGLKAALISTGIGILVVAVGELIANFDKLTEWFGNLTNNTNEYENANENLNASFETQNKELDREITLMQASGASTQDIINKKKKLKEEQLAETEATKKNIEARNDQLKADKRWWKFWSNKKIDKQIEENNEEIKKLNETAETLKEDIIDLDTEAKADVLKTTRETNKKLKDEADKLADEISKTAKKVGDDVKKQLDELVKQYSKTIKSIQTITGALNATNLIEGAVSSDIDAWMTVYSTDPKRMEKDLTGTLNALVSYAYEEAVRIRDEALSKAKNDLEKDEIGKAFTDSITNIYKTAYPEMEQTGFGIGDAIVTGTNEAITESKSISQTFTEQFNALNHLYEEGIIDYEEFYDTLVNIQNDYNTAVKDFDEKYIDETEQSEEYIAQLKYNYALKPLAFQQEVGDKFLAELDKQNMLIEANSARCWDVYNISLKAQLEKAAETWNLYSSGTLKQRYESEQNQLDFQKGVYDQEYDAKVEHINNLLDLDTLTVEQEAALRDQLEQLNRDKIQNDVNYYAESTRIRDEYYASLGEAFSQGYQATTDLISNLASAYAEYAEQMKDADGNYTKEGKKMLETSANLQKATAIMNAAAGIATVWAQSAQLGPIAGPIVAGIQTAAHLANLTVQLNSIDRALNQGINGNVSGGGTTSPTPDTSFTLTSPDAYQNTLSDEVQTDLQANAKDNQRVYVVSSDISNAQHNEKTTVTTATF